MSGDIDKAKRLYRKFHDAPPGRLDRVNLPVHDVVLKIGECTHVAYRTEDGENYIHRFKKGSRAVLAVSPDGKQLYLIGGRYEFTDRGIVDR